MVVLRIPCAADIVYSLSVVTGNHHRTCYSWKNCKKGSLVSSATDLNCPGAAAIILFILCSLYAPKVETFQWFHDKGRKLWVIFFLPIHIDETSSLGIHFWITLEGFEKEKADRKTQTEKKRLRLGI